MLIHIFLCKLIYREDTVFGTCLDSHIGNCKSVIHSKILNSFTDKLHRTIVLVPGLYVLFQTLREKVRGPKNL